MLFDIQINKNIKEISKHVKDNSDSGWNSTLQEYFQTSELSHDSLTNTYLEKQIRTYSIKRKFSFSKKTVFFVEVLTSGFTQMDLFFESINVVELTEVIADEWSSLISDFGGQLGLWVGISLTNVMELIFFVHWLLILKFGKSAVRKTARAVRRLSIQTAAQEVVVARKSVNVWKRKSVGQAVGVRDELQDF